MEHVSTLHVSRATDTDITDLADVAARTFPLACPPSATPDNIAAFIAENLSAPQFTAYLSDADRAVFLARDGGDAVGYAMTIRGLPDDPDVRRAVPVLPTVELSKIYVLPSSHGGAASAALMAAVLDYACAAGAASVWLGVNQENQRAQRFYTKQGFTVTGTKSFRLGAGVEHDYVLTRPLRRPS
ncbi:GNAT family N-acetyltransferase [Mycolicibacterium murale]|jgi:ribosomal protein S18 acetylase RimI-like enzyme|uniref:GNAT family N-acetyltransferase n=1 Tax=Mycolicibacterium murale TaxID=182220 RepID=UPI0018766DE8|nr:GNAT family N-acetyltransferase [Mycolicibacterium murale]MCV7186028.1 GNAT family N-acetyltransferase [Mycolicibacterium murale]